MNDKPGHIIDFELLAKHFANETTGLEDQSVLDWVSASSENKDSYEALRIVWLDTGAIEKPVPSEKINVDAAWSKMQARMSAPTISTSNQRTSSNTWMRVAAAIVLLIGAGVLIRFFISDNNVDNSVSETTLTASATNDTVSTVLSDQSRITLNKGAEISYPERFSGNTRTVALKGEAYFEVSRNETKPFIVEANNAIITVLGTAFKVSAEPGSDSVVVVVTEGKVSLSDGEKEIILTKDMKGILDLKTGELTTMSPEALETFWVNHDIRFSNAPLDHVTHVIEMVYNVEIELAVQNLDSCFMTVHFGEQTSLEMALEIISSTLGVEYQHQPDKIILYGEGCY